MAKQAAGLPQDVACLHRVVQGQEEQSPLPSHGDAPSIYQAVRPRLQVIRLDTALALSIGVGPGAPSVHAGSWGTLEVLGEGPGLQSHR